METLCVLAFKNDSVLSLALANLINASNNGLAVYESNAHSLEELIGAIDILKADVVLLEKSCAFAGQDALSKLLMLFPNLLVIVVNEDNNWLHIFRRTDVLLTSSTDLIGVIQSA